VSDPTIVAFVSPKGGQGCTTVAAMYALHLSDRYSVGIVAHDVGDMASTLGLPADAIYDSPAGSAFPVNGENVNLLNRPQFSPFMGDAFGQVIVVDCGLDDPMIEPTPALTFMVVRSSFLALRRALRAGYEVDGVILLHEPGHSLTKGDVELALSRPIVAEMDIDAEITSVVDAGLLPFRTPRVAYAPLRRIHDAVRRSRDISPDRVS
jgi:hypothetical protein